MSGARQTSGQILALPAGVRASLIAWSAQARPAEACGLLIGSRSTAALAIRCATRARNLQCDPERYEIDPADHLAAQLQARAAGLEVLGAWHSHPRGPARPSARDEREALAGWTYLIVDASSGELSAWQLDATGRFGGAALSSDMP